MRHASFCRIFTVSDATFGAGLDCRDNRCRPRIIAFLRAKSPLALLTHIKQKASSWPDFHQSLPIRRNFNNIKHLKGGFYPKIFSYLKKYVYLCPTFSEVRPRSPGYIAPDSVDAERVRNTTKIENTRKTLINNEQS